MIAEALSRWIAPRATRGPTDDFWYRPIGAQSTAGVDVTIDKAMALSTAFACIRLLSEVVGSLPCLVYERTGEDKRRATEHPLYYLLHEQPNTWQTPQQFFEMLVAHINLRGNFYARIVPGLRGGVTQLVPLNPDPQRMWVEQMADGTLLYHYREEDGREDTYAQNEIFHVAGLTANGITGVSVLEYARNALGLGLAQETHGAGLFKNGALPAFWIKRPPGVKWSDSARNNFRAGWRGMHAGAENAHNPPILEDGMELMSLGLTNEDSQWLESRQFQAVEICRFFRVPPHMAGILDRATFSNIEHQGIEFVTYTLAPWLTRISQAAKRDLIADDRFFVEFLADALLRGETKSRYEAYNLAINGGWMTRNEARRRENWNALEGLDEPLEPLNMAPAGSREAGGQAPEGDDTEAARPNLVPVIEDAAARIVANEIRLLEARADKAAEDRTKWDQWAAGQYERHRAYVAAALAPIAAAVCSQVDVQALAHSLATESVSELAGADVPAVLEQWKQHKAAEVAERLKDLLR